jgi:hypothetical protein
LLLVSVSVGADDTPKPSVAEAPTEVAAPTDTIPTAPLVPWDETEQHVGEEATVEGRILGVHCSPLSCVLAFDPSFSRFRIVVQARRFTAFPPERLSERYSGKRVHVHGKITQSGGRPEITIDRPDDLTVMVAERRREQAQRADEAQQANAELLDRVASSLERLEALSEQILATQQRLEVVLAALEQRTAVLENAAVGQETASAGPPPRRGFERGRTVKRGMSRTDVARLMGDPQNVEPGGGGWATWYWDAGQSVTFDARGRAQSLSGFSAR